MTQFSYPVKLEKQFAALAVEHVHATIRQASPAVTARHGTAQKLSFSFMYQTAPSFLLIGLFNLKVFILIGLGSGRSLLASVRIALVQSWHIWKADVLTSSQNVVASMTFYTLLQSVLEAHHNSLQ
ncbi:hypothetical protein C0J52_20987 [Blattella germanica]|nr:hypothetical protein C0J52_20987 [Blattella germanica]